MLMIQVQGYHAMTCECDQNVCDIFKILKFGTLNSSKVT